MNQPVVFMSKDFFVAFCKELSKPYDKITVPKRNLIYIEDLIFNKATVYINIADDEMSHYIGTNPHELEDENEQLLCVYLKKLFSQNKIRSCKNELEIFRTENKQMEYFSLKKKPNFLFISDHQQFCKKIEVDFGIICVSKNMELCEENTRAEIKIIEAGTNLDLKHCTDKLPKCNSIIIEDPYLLNQTKEFVGDLVNSFYLDSKALGVFYVTMIVTNKEGKNIDSIKAYLKTRFSHIQIEIYTRAHGRIHDRNIYSNTFWLTCDYGFQEKYSSPTKWAIFPIGIYFPEYSERKNLTVRGAIQHDIPSLNYLTN